MAKIKRHGEHATVNALSKLLGSTRRTISARIRTAGLKPTGKRRGFAIYQVAAVRSLLAVPTDPDKMTGFQRNAHFQAEELERELRERCAQLIRRDDAERGFERTNKIIEAALHDLPRRLARIPGVDAQMEMKIHGHFSQLRRDLRNLDASRKARWADKANGSRSDSSSDAENSDV